MAEVGKADVERVWQGQDATCDAIVGIAGDMAVHHIQQHQQPQPVRLIYKSLQPLTPFDQYQDGMK